MRHLALAGALALACLTTSAHADDAGIHEFLRSQPNLPVVERVVEAPARAVRAVRGWFGHHDSAPVGRAEIARVVAEAARRHGVPEGLALGVASVESGFNPRARNRSGATGLMQLLPSTARGLGCRGNLADARVNADCGARYLARTFARAHGNLAVAAALFNQGEYGSPRRGARYAALVMAHIRKFAS